MLVRVTALSILLQVLNSLEPAIIFSQRLVSFLGFGLAALAFVTVQGFAIERLFVNALAY
ncbi:MAG: hypothetical protein WDO72_02525 [Pseudomonadota bacterium]